MTAAPQPGLVIEYPVLYDTRSAGLKRAFARRRRNSRLISLLISAVIAVVIYFFFRDSLGENIWWLVGISLVFPLVMLAWAILAEARVRREVAVVGDGLALGITREGLVLADGSWLPWSGLDGVRAKHRRLGRGPDLVLSSGGRLVTLPLAHLSGTPASIDGAIWAFSGGRFRIDFTHLGA